MKNSIGKHNFSLTLAIILLVALPFEAAPADCLGQSQSLFNGRTLEGWQVSKFGTQGRAYVADSLIVITRGEGCSGITYLNDFPVMNYEVSLEAKRLVGNDFFCSMTFPIGEDFCTLIVGGWGDLVVGLSNVDGLDASRNETNTLGVFENDRWYKVRLRVSTHRIQVWIDDEKYLDFDTSGHEISIRPTMQVAKPFGISTWETTAAIRRICLRTF